MRADDPSPASIETVALAPDIATGDYNGLATGKVR
jgi:hypothetical protein